MMDLLQFIMQVETSTVVGGNALFICEALSYYTIIQPMLDLSFSIIVVLMVQ